MTPPVPPSDNPDPAFVQWLREHRAAGEPTFDADAAWARFQSHRTVRPIATVRRSRRPAFVAAGAMTLAAATIAFMIVSHRASLKTDVASAMTTRVAALGQRDTITLDDGSRITLNGGSRLQYSSRAGDRDVYLDGEALFEITHDARRAFRVHAANGVVEDIGTRFTIRANAERRSVEVAVAEGKVAFGADSSGPPHLQLSAGDAAAIDSSGVVKKLPAETIDRLVGWTTGALVFDNTTLGEAASDIERRYGVHVTIADSALAKRPVVARFHGEPVTQVLDAIALALGAHYDASGAMYTLRPGLR